jgi:hypothetical protein
MAISLKYESLKLLLRYPHNKKQASAVPSAFIFHRRQLACFQGVFSAGSIVAPNHASLALHRRGSSAARHAPLRCKWGGLHLQIFICGKHRPS